MSEKPGYITVRAAAHKGRDWRLFELPPDSQLDTRALACIKDAIAAGFPELVITVETSPEGVLVQAIDAYEWRHRNHLKHCVIRTINQEVKRQKAPK
ncbi:MAG TPA: hypothetical protein VFW52_03660 [Candidatus Saccharimonadales bacterium]|nr:hypothetical protein [Candidatus Saccharimonadales bacterium]